MNCQSSPECAHSSTERACFNNLKYEFGGGMPRTRLGPCRNINVYLFEPNPLLRKIINSQLKTCPKVRVINSKLQSDRFAANGGALSIVILDRGTLGSRFRA